jgi:preprotein translocase subunit SecE
VADKKRRGDDEFADDRLDDEAFDDEAFDDVLDDDDTDEEPVSRGGTATRSRVKAGSEVPRRTETGRVGFFGRIARFFREVVAELRKVIWPTRKELLTYTSVVVVFVAVMLGIVVLLDYAFAKGVLWVFGN